MQLVFIVMHLYIFFLIITIGISKSCWLLWLAPLKEQVTKGNDISSFLFFFPELSNEKKNMS